MWHLLAEGGYAKVYVNDDKTCVKKVLTKHLDTFDINYNAIIDLSVQKSCGHIRGIPELTSFEITDQEVILYMPYYGVPLNKLPCQNNPDLIVHVITRLCEVLIKLERYAGILHTDLKPSNVLYDTRTDEVTLIDYNIISYAFNKKGEKAYTAAYGTWGYVAPEITLHLKPHVRSASWSIGLLVAYMYNRHPWEGYYELTSKQISSRSFWKKFLLQIGDNFPLSDVHTSCMQPYHVALYRRCMISDPTKRISVEDILLYLSPPSYAYLSNIVSSEYLNSPILISNINSDTRFIILHKLYNISRITQSLHVFVRSVMLFDRAYHPNVHNVFELGCACHCLALMLSGRYVFHENDSQSTIATYWQIGDAIEHVKSIVWYVAQQCADVLWMKCVDVLLLEEGHKVDYDIIKSHLVQAQMSYDTFSILKDIIANS